MICTSSEVEFTTNWQIINFKMNSQTSTKKRNQKEQEKSSQKVAVRLLSEMVEHLRPTV